MLNFYKNLKSQSKQKDISVKYLIDLIRNGYQFTELILTARKFGKQHSLYDTIKKEQVPCYLPNGYSTGRRKKEDITHSTGYMYFDVDGIDNTDDVIDYLKEFDFVYAAWKSFGGKGLGWLVRVDGINKDNFKDAFKEISLKLNIDIDKHVGNINRCNVISYDPDVYVNHSVVPYNYIEKINYVKNINENKTIVSNNDQQYQYNYIYTGSTVDYRNVNYYTTLSDNEFGDKEYVFDISGKSYIGLYVNPNTVVTEGGRNGFIGKITGILVYLNPDTKKELVIKAIDWYNKRFCDPPLSYQEVCVLYETNFRWYQNNTLKVPTKNKYTWFKKDSTLTTSQKKSIAGKNTGIIRRLRTIIMLLGAVDELRDEGNNKITQRMLAEKSGKHIQTVKKYWKELGC